MITNIIVKFEIIVTVMMMVIIIVIINDNDHLYRRVAGKCYNIACEYLQPGSTKGLNSSLIDSSYT